ncbi:MAG: DUF4845 domain-containing protein [Gammaproteobacteria bacterium]
MHTRIRAGQRGLTLIGLLFGAFLLGFTALVLMKLFPLYNEYFKVRAAMEAVSKQPDIANMNAQEIRAFMMRNFDVSDVDRLTDADLKKYLQVTRGEGGKDRVMSMVYEARGALFGNLDIVLKVDERLSIPGVAFE